MLFYCTMTTLFELAIYCNANFKSKAVLRSFCHPRGASAMGRISFAKLRSWIVKFRERFLKLREWINVFFFTWYQGASYFPFCLYFSSTLKLHIFLILANFDLDFNSIQCRIFPSAKIKRTSVSLHCQAWMLGVSEDCSASPNFLNSQISL